jgi:hypothetical protein
MSQNSMTAEYNELVEISQSLSREYKNKKKQWIGSPFEWIKYQSSRSIGAIGEKIVASWLAMHDFNVVRSPDSEADRVVDGKRVEIKFSTQWENGTYLFEQLRDQNYEFAIFLGVSPNDAHCWVIPKADIVRMWKVERTLPPQHGGEEGEDTAWARLSPAASGAAQDEACRKYGNGLRDALLSISRLTGHKLVGLSSVLEA